MDRSKWNNMPQCADITPMMRFFPKKKHLPKNSTIAYVVVWNFQIFKICTRWEGGYAYNCSVVGVTLLPIVLHFSFLLLFLFSFLLSFLFSSFLFSLFASPASPCFSCHAFLPSACMCARESSCMPQKKNFLGHNSHNGGAIWQWPRLEKNFRHTLVVVFFSGHDFH